MQKYAENADTDVNTAKANGWRPRAAEKRAFLLDKSTRQGYRHRLAGNEYGFGNPEEKTSPSPPKRSIPKPSVPPWVSTLPMTTKAAMAHQSHRK
ncbi:hypothetical protein [Haloferula sargassicola]|uniref:hypothetical protein n=1 Tax=Haloferula sargassicola TaxID=490096 RepID=UPI0033657917